MDPIERVRSQVLTYCTFLALSQATPRSHVITDSQNAQRSTRRSASSLDWVRTPTFTFTSAFTFVFAFTFDPDVIRAPTFGVYGTHRHRLTSARARARVRAERAIDGRDGTDADMLTDADADTDTDADANPSWMRTLMGGPAVASSVRCLCLCRGWTGRWGRVLVHVLLLGFCIFKARLVRLVIRTRQDRIGQPPGNEQSLRLRNTLPRYLPCLLPCLLPWMDG